MYVCMYLIMYHGHEQDPPPRPVLIMSRGPMDRYILSFMTTDCSWVRYSKAIQDHELAPLDRFRALDSSSRLGSIDR